jgi:hypothetical protein
VGPLNLVCVKHAVMVMRKIPFVKTESTYPLGVPSTVPMDQRVLGRLRLEVRVRVEVLPALTVTLPVPASSSPWKSVTVYVPGFMRSRLKLDLKVVGTVVKSFIETHLP